MFDTLSSRASHGDEVFIMGSANGEFFLFIYSFVIIFIQAEYWFKYLFLFLLRQCW